MNTLPRCQALAALILLVLTGTQCRRAASTAAKVPEPPAVAETPQAPVPPGFALIPAGEFVMGDALDGDKYAYRHSVYVGDFYMQKNEVTKAEWEEVQEWGREHGHFDMAKGRGKAADHPVQGVTWNDVVKWCNAHSEKDGLVPCYYTDVAQTEIYRSDSKKLSIAMVKWDATGYRLPTEAEWEKAARGGLVGKRFPWGDTISHEQANFGNKGKEAYQSGSAGYHPAYKTGADPYTSPVGSFAPNGYGLLDMAGNVSEWCWDWYEGQPSQFVKNPRGAPSHMFRVIRGGGWDDNAADCRVAIRHVSFPGHMANHLGFRPVRTLR